MWPLVEPLSPGEIIVCEGLSFSYVGGSRDSLFVPPYWAYWQYL